MGRPREHDETTRQALLDAAERLLATEGAEALSVRRVADAVGTTTRAVYSVLGGKEGLVSALYRRSLDALNHAVDAVPKTPDPRADLIAMGVDGFRSYALGVPHLFRLVFERMARDVSPSPEDVAAADAAFARVTRAVQRCIDAGVLPGRHAGRIAIEFHAICQGLAGVEHLGWLARARAPRDLWRETLAAFVDGLAAAASPPRRARARR
jgi:AcrR family transcriptional regulator